MKFIARLAILITLIAISDGAIFLVLTRNLENGVYPSDGDSLGIPFVESAILSLFAVGLLLVSVIASAFSWSLRNGNGSSLRHYVFAGMVMITHALSAVYFAVWGLSWVMPNHYLIAATFGVSVAVIIYFAAVDLFQLRSNHSLQGRRR